MTWGEDQRVKGKGMTGRSLQEGLSRLAVGGGLLLALCLAGCGPKPEGQPFEGEINVKLEPEQTPAEGAERIILKSRGFTWMLEPKAGYLVDGIVLSKKNYGSDWNAMLSPCDIALAWGQMVSTGLYKQCRWSQSGRWYYWRYDKDFPFDNTFVAKWSANTHIIPANDNIRRTLGGVSSGDTVRLEGYLVYVTGGDGKETYTWNSSLSRDDQGDGSCEVLYLTSLTLRGMIYK